MGLVFRWMTIALSDLCADEMTATARLLKRSCDGGSEPCELSLRQKAVLDFSATKCALNSFFEVVIGMKVLDDAFSHSIHTVGWSNSVEMWLNLILKEISVKFTKTVNILWIFNDWPKVHGVQYCIVFFLLSNISSYGITIWWLTKRYEDPSFYQSTINFNWAASSLLNDNDFNES